jgi:pre-mRNA cleavage complex 2 protein Pcf11
MQNILDELQSDVNNELEKVSLERLADINPDLLSQIKKTAEDNMRTVPSAQTGARDEDQEQLPSFFTETRPPKVLERSKEWRELENWDYLKKSHDVITNLQHAVRKGAESNGRYTQQEALDMTHYFATASATASLLTEALERIKNQQDRTNHKKRVSFPGTGSSGVTVTAAIGLDPKDFTNDGIKKKNETVISLLYEIGLPFLHSKTGRRFRKQEELAAYMDVVFKKTQLEKSMARTEERGWYVADAVWAGEGGEEDLLPTADTAEAAQTSAAEDEFAPDRSTVPADESRDRCVICGINFKMSFDNEAGLYMYSNCREIVVLNDDAAEKESEDELVHVTCWKGLGGPEVLTSDQTLQETLRY